jgi:hypothetical protein
VLVVNNDKFMYKYYKVIQIYSAWVNIRISLASHSI